ncbi:hypothetical protein EHQ53_02210 [Leptospira langatensis]|uniref:Uncharacterized protein n=1 Tax=Leptospira langatensis TaxID=2484983 RepID=A0A5F1ZYZ2_9LEPT|nr:hypothetical protein [Leptospira langatensis]TGJ98556.1 hypothetical protein EHO57_18350 [Leptospira langatensis]TGL43470.1 hypothetical protein EHQ53_02210 [Leptospira langatensis]
MASHSSLEETIRSFLETFQGGVKESDQEISTLLLEFSGLLFENPEEEKEKKIQVSDLTGFELDEFLNFYLEDMFPDDSRIRSKAKDFLKKFKKYLDKNSLLNAEQAEDWKEFFKENEIR